MNRKMLARVVVVIALLVSWSAPAAVMVRMTLDDLVRNAEAVVLGKVTHSKAFLDEEAGRIYTIHTFKVADYLKGGGEKEIEVITAGGELEDIGQLVPGTPKLNKDEEVVLCLKSGKRAFSVVGMAQGKLRLEKRKEKSFLVRDLKGLYFVGEGKNRQKSDELPLETFKELILRLKK